jgi:GT2 family glycosyltransferase
MTNETSVIGAGPGEPGLVSVVIPTYQRGYILDRAIQSVLDQTYRQVEIVVADDGSTDSTHEVVARFGPVVRYFHQPNAGVSAARNLGLRNARGEFVALLDSDDCWLPWKLEAQVRLLKRFPEVGMVWTDMVAIDDDGRCLDEAHLRNFYDAYRELPTNDFFERSGRLVDLWPQAPEQLAERNYFVGDIFSQMLLGNLVHTSTVLMRRERLQLVGGFDQTHRFAGEDYEYHLTTSYHGPVAFLDLSSILYRVGAPDQITAPHLALYFAQGNLRTVQAWLDRARGRITLTPAQLRRRMAGSFGWAGREELRAGQLGAARKHLLKSLSLRPLQPRLAALLALSLLPRKVYERLQFVRHVDRTAVNAQDKAATTALERDHALTP